jgi:ferredoxin
MTAPTKPAGPAFEIELQQTGVVLTVTPDQSVLDAVLSVLPDTPWGCREGYCGACQTTVLAGEPEHHDIFLTPAERASNATMMLCVGRAASSRLVLDL